MSRNPRLAWRQGTYFAAWWVNAVVGIIFGFWGKNPFDPDGIIWRVQPQNDLFLWISTIAFLMAVVLSYAIWPLARAEVARKDRPGNKASRAHWYQAGNTIRINWLFYMVVWPGICITQIFRNVAALSNLEIFSWLSDAVFLVAMIVDIVAVVLIIKNFRTLAREKGAHTD